MRKGFLMRLHVQGEHRTVYRPEWVGVGCNMAFRRDELLAVGGFDPALDVGTPTSGGGDLDAFQRMLESGAAIVYRPDAVVRHLHRRELPRLRRQLFDNGRGYAAMLLAARERGTRADRRQSAAASRAGYCAGTRSGFSGARSAESAFRPPSSWQRHSAPPSAPRSTFGPGATPDARRGRGIVVSARTQQRSGDREGATSRIRRVGHLKDTSGASSASSRAQHRGSALGWLWALGPPLLLLGATYFVFTRVVPLDVPDYPVFLLTGILGWTLFARGVGEGTSAIEQRRELALRPGFALALLPLTAVLVALVD